MSGVTLIALALAAHLMGRHVIVPALTGGHATVGALARACTVAVVLSAVVVTCPWLTQPLR